MEHPDDRLPGTPGDGGPASGGREDEAGALLDALWESSPVPFAYFGTDLRYRRVNRAVGDVDGGGADQRLGRTVEEVHGHTGAVIADIMRGALADGLPRVGVPVRGRLWHGEGPVQEWRITAYPVRARAGAVVGVGMVANEVTSSSAVRRERDRVAAEREHALVRYRSLVDVAGSAVWVREIDGSAERDAPVLRGLTGQTFGQMRGWGFLEAVHPEHRAGWWEGWERAALTREQFTHAYRLRTGSGEYRWFRTRAVPVLVGGRVVEWTGTETDVDAEVRARARLDVLAQATLAVNSVASTAAGPDGELTALADAMVPAFADVCRAYLVDPVRRTGAVTGRRSATSTAAHVREPVMAGRFVFGPAHPISRSVRAGEPVLVDLAAERTEDWTPTAAQLQWGTELDAHSMLVTPVVSRGVVVAALLFMASGDRPRYTHEDLALVTEISQRASLAVERAAALHHNRQVAVTLQAAMLTDPPVVPGVRIEPRYLPAAAELSVGGDWYDAFALPGGELAIGVGDVSGHDLPAATTMGQLRSMLRALADGAAPPSAAVAALDRVACRLGVTAFTTLVHGHLVPTADGTRFRWSNAGHPPPVLVSPGRPARYLHAPVDVVLGVAPGSARHDHEVGLPPGSTLLLYTDGLVERRHDPDDTAASRLLTDVDELAGLPLSELCDQLIRGSAADTDDDIVVLAVRLDP